MKLFEVNVDVGFFQKDDIVEIVDYIVHEGEDYFGVTIMQEVINGELISYTGTDTKRYIRTQYISITKEEFPEYFL